MRFLRHLFFLPLPAGTCGHEARRRVMRVSAFGETRLIQAPVEDGRVPYCADCLSKMAIQCAWCKRPIFVGDVITLLSPMNGQAPEHATVYSEDPLALVGCGRSDCADTAAEYCGYWLPAGVFLGGKWLGGVRRFTSVLEQVMESGEGMVVNDIDAHARTRMAASVTIPVRFALAPGAVVPPA